MNGIRNTILYGPTDRQTWSALEQWLLSYAKNNPSTKEPEYENTATYKSEMQAL